MKGKSEAKLLNVIYGNVKILSFENLSLDKKRTKYLTECLICKNQSIRRFDHIKNCPEYCKFCRDNRIAKSRVTPNTVYNCLYGAYKRNAESRNLEFTITKEYFINKIKESCFYCGEIPYETDTSKKYNRSKIPVLHNGIDRIDSLKGYTVENIVCSCGTCNLMKNKFSKEVFFDKINKIYNKHLKECSTTISKESTIEANAIGKGENPEKGL